MVARETGFEEEAKVMGERVAAVAVVCSGQTLTLRVAGAVEKNIPAAEDNALISSLRAIHGWQNLARI